MSSWLFLHEGNCPPRLTMTTDLELFEAVKHNSIPGALRIYNWAEPAVTTGFHQQGFTFYDETLVLPVLQRPTGGGSVLHGNDITFSICTPVDTVFPGNIRECSLTISRIFAAALRRCGMEARVRGGKHAFSPICFARPSPVELVADGGKIMGLALARKGAFMLVQGVMPLTIDGELAGRVFGPGTLPKTRGILELCPGFPLDGFIESLRECLASQHGVFLEEHRTEDHQYGSTNERKIEPGRKILRQEYFSEQ